MRDYVSRNPVYSDTSWAYWCEKHGDEEADQNDLWAAS